MIYLDNAATTRVYDESIEIASKYMRDIYGNSGSLHSMGLDASKAIDVSRKLIAYKINAEAEDILFTSGATESNNIVFNSVKKLKNKNKIIISSIEHASVYAPAKRLEAEGYELVVVDVNRDGIVEIDKLIREVDDKTALVSIMMVNNEISVIQDIEEIGNRLKKIGYSGLFHTDATQAVCKINVDTKKLGVDFLSSSAHKFHGPKGVGFLYVKNKNTISPLFIGGSQERGFRAGTENVPLITAMAKAFSISMDNLDETYQRLSTYRDKLYKYANKSSDIEPVITDTIHLCPYIVSIAYKNMKSEVLLHAFESRGIAVSSGSACSSKSKKISRVLSAVGIEEDYSEGVIRVSFSRYTTKSDIDSFISASEDILKGIKRIK